MSGNDLRRRNNPCLIDVVRLLLFLLRSVLSEDNNLVGRGVLIRRRRLGSRVDDTRVR